MVTGGAGYIGSHVSKALAEAGYVPVAYDNLSNGHAASARWGPLVRGDVLDRAALVATLRKYRIAGVIHLAGVIEVGASVTRPLDYVTINVTGSATLLQAMAEERINTIVFSSSCAVYGMPERLPIDEDHPQNPVSPYGGTKLMVEQMLKWTRAAHGINFMALRYFNAAGAARAGEIGEMHHPETHLIPLILDAALGRRAGIDIYGSDWETPDGTCVRDFVHVEDLAAAHVLALGHLSAGEASSFLNLGGGVGHSVDEVIDAVERLTNRKIKRNRVARRAGDAPILLADTRKAQMQLGWCATHSELDAIIESAWRWHQRQFSAASKSDI
ncbi:MAG: UDP-glucose 4-epimerase GalE [Stellaceae bacterium]